MLIPEIFNQIRLPFYLIKVAPLTVSMTTTNKGDYIFKVPHHAAGAKDNRKSVRNSTGDPASYITVPYFRRSSESERSREQQTEKHCGRVVSKAGKNM